MHLALACVIRARHELYVYYINDGKFLGYVLTTLFVIILFNFAPYDANEKHVKGFIYRICKLQK
jgi:hypothetical protein